MVEVSVSYPLGDVWENDAILDRIAETRSAERVSSGAGFGERDIQYEVADLAIADLLKEDFLNLGIEGLVVMLDDVSE